MGNLGWIGKNKRNLRFECVLFCVFENTDRIFKNPDHVFENPDRVFENPDRVFENLDCVFENPDLVLENPDRVFKNSDCVSEVIPFVYMKYSFLCIQLSVPVFVNIFLICI